jgi:hypothetical protein
LNNEELTDQWKKSITVPVHKKGDKTDCNNYRGISLLSTSYKMLSNILLSFFFIIPVYLQSVQVHSINWLKEVDEGLGEGRSLALFYN